MRVTRWNNRVVIRCSPNEFEILGIAVDQVEVGDPYELISDTNLRKSWGRRAIGGSFLRIDKDKRTEEHLHD